MHNQKKTASVLSALLIIAMLLTSFAACSDSGDSTATDTTAADTIAETTTEAPETVLKSGVPEGTDFGGEEVTILYAPTQAGDDVLFAAVEENGEALNDAVYNRNLTIMDRLGVNIAFTSVFHDDVPNKVRTSVQAGDDEFDLVSSAQYILVKMINDGVYMNIYDSDYIDIDQPWWATEYIENINIGHDRLYLLTGDITPLFLRWISACYFNKNLYKSIHGDPNDMYDTVLDGKWTYDTVEKLTKDVYADLNGNGVTDSEDMLGYGTNANALSDSFYINMGGTYVKDDPDGMPVLDPVTDRTVGMIEALYSFYFENPSCLIYGWSWNEFNNHITPKFAADEMMFLFAYFFTSDHLRDMDSDYGIIPYPKYDEIQDNYRALVHNDVCACAVPITCQKPELVCAVMEELAFEGYMSTSPTYYDIVLKGKYLREEADIGTEMLDMIHDMACTETGYAYASMLANAGYMHRTLILDKKSSDLASLWASMETKSNEALNTLLESYCAVK